MGVPPVHKHVLGVGRLHGIHARHENLRRLYADLFIVGVYSFSLVGDSCSIHTNGGGDRIRIFRVQAKEMESIIKTLALFAQKMKIPNTLRLLRILWQTTENEV